MSVAPDDAVGTYRIGAAGTLKTKAHAAVHKTKWHSADKGSTGTEVQLIWKTLRSTFVHTPSDWVLSALFHFTIGRRIFCLKKNE